MALHKDLSGAHMHKAYPYAYANSTTRNAALTGKTDAYIGTLCLQLDNYTLWYVAKDSALYWKQLSDETHNHNTNYLSLSGGTVTGDLTVDQGRLSVQGNQSRSSWTYTGAQFATVAATLTDTTGSGTIAHRAVNSFAQSTLGASNAVTLTRAATLTINNAPAAGTNVTITNPYALAILNGQSFFEEGFRMGDGKIIKTEGDATYLGYAGASASFYGASMLCYGRDHTSYPGRLSLRYGGYDDLGVIMFGQINSSGNVNTRGGVNSYGNLYLGTSSTVLGNVSGTQCIYLANGGEPTPQTDTPALSAKDVTAGNSCIHAWSEAGHVIKLFSGAALTAQLTTLTCSSPGTPDYAIANPINSNAWGFSSSDEFLSTIKVIANLQTRVGQLESRMIANGLILSA